MDANKDVGLKDARLYEVDPSFFTSGHGVGDIVQLTDGRLLYAFSSRPGGLGGILGSYSGDEGENWSKPRVLIPAPEERFSYPDGEILQEPSFLRRQDGMLILSYNWVVGVWHGWTTYRRSHTYFRLSDDEGEAWSDPKVLTGSEEHASLVHNNKLLRLMSGRILAPAEVQVDLGLGNDHRGWVSAVWRSDDDGHTWHRSANVVNMLDQGIEAQEPHVVELRDGRTMMLFRTYSGYVGRAYSDDQGESWSSGEMVEELVLPPNSSALHVSRVPSSGDLLLVRSTGEGRTPFTSVISRDDGRTWSNERVIADKPNGRYGYSSVLHLDRVTLISYASSNGLHVVRIPTSWFCEQD